MILKTDWEHRKESLDYIMESLEWLATELRDTGFLALPVFEKLHVELEHYLIPQWDLVDSIISEDFGQLTPIFELWAEILEAGSVTLSGWDPVILPLSLRGLGSYAIYFFDVEDEEVELIKGGLNRHQAQLIMEEYTYGMFLQGWDRHHRDNGYMTEYVMKSALHGDLYAFVAQERN